MRDDKINGLSNQLEAARDEAKSWMKEATNFREDVNFLTQQSNMLIDELQTESKTVKSLRDELKERNIILEQQQEQRKRFLEEKNELLRSERQEWNLERNELER